jgi:hypothetical protein
MAQQTSFSTSQEVQELSASDLEGLTGGIVPLLVVGAAALLLSGCVTIPKPPLKAGRDPIFN